MSSEIILFANFPSVSRDNSRRNNNSNNTSAKSSTRHLEMLSKFKQSWQTLATDFAIDVFAQMRSKCCSSSIEQLSGVDCVSHELDVSQSVVYSLLRWSRFSSSPVSLSAFRWVKSNERVHRSDSITLRRWLPHTGRPMDAPVDHVRLAVPKHAAATNASRNVTAIATIRNAPNA